VAEEGAKSAHGVSNLASAFNDVLVGLFGVEIHSQVSSKAVIREVD
jgi:hypothetical protein